VLVLLQINIIYSTEYTPIFSVGLLGGLTTAKMKKNIIQLKIKQSTFVGLFCWLILLAYSAGLFCWLILLAYSANLIPYMLSI
jgi:hypothetical protein